MSLCFWRLYSLCCSRPSTLLCTVFLSIFLSALCSQGGGGRGGERGREGGIAAPLYLEKLFILCCNYDRTSVTKPSLCIIFIGAARTIKKSGIIIFIVDDYKIGTISTESISLCPSPTTAIILSWGRTAGKKQCRFLFMRQITFQESVTALYTGALPRSHLHQCLYIALVEPPPIASRWPCRVTRDDRVTSSATSLHAPLVFLTAGDCSCVVADWRRSLTHTIIKTDFVHSL